MSRRVLALTAFSVLVATAVPGRAAAPIDEVRDGVTVTAPALPATIPFDVVSVFQTTDITAEMHARAQAAAQSVGAVVTQSRGASIGMTAVARDGSPVQLAPLGYQYPMAVTVLPADAVAGLMGREVSAHVAGGSVVMGSTSAGLRGAEAGDTVTLVAADGGSRVLTIGAVADDSVVGGTELVVSPAVADALGVTRITRLLIYGFPDRASIEAALAAHGVVNRTSIGGQRVRIRRSWDPRDPDSTLGLAATKALLGEPAYRVNSNGIDVSLSADWTNTYLPAEREWLYAYPGAPAHAAYTIRARCNLAIKDDLIAALAEVHAAGLDGAIDFVNANTYGGCFYPRFNRVSGALGFLSRHSWGMALDTNTTTNAQGSTPQMDCRVVRIFRKHNFAWGGNFPSIDGMHFEWVGERRDQLDYPSTYCPNVGLATPQAVGDEIAAAGDGRATMFADDGWAEAEGAGDHAG